MNELKKQAPELGLGMLPDDVWKNSILEYARPEGEEDMKKKKKKNEEESVPDIGPINIGRNAVCRCDGCEKFRQQNSKGFCKTHCRLWGHLCADIKPFGLL